MKLFSRVRKAAWPVALAAPNRDWVYCPSAEVVLAFAALGTDFSSEAEKHEVCMVACTVFTDQAALVSL